MNDDPFERQLRALSAGLRRPDPTPGWKTEILARAQREAKAERPARLLPPRWLMLSWATAWAAIVLLFATAPRDDVAPGGAETAQTPESGIHEPTDEPFTQLADDQRLKLFLDLP